MDDNLGINPPDQNVPADPSNVPTQPDVISGAGTPAPGQMPNVSATPPVTDPLSPPPVKVSGMDPTQFTQAQVAQNAANAQAAKEKGDATAAGHLAKADIYKQQSTDEKKKIDEIKTLSDIAKQKSDKAQIDDEAAYRTEMKKERDPDHWWNSKSTGQKAEATIGLLISGIGQGLQSYGGMKDARNMAMDNMDKAIHRDIDAQDANKKDRLDEISRITGIHKDSANLEHAYIMDKEHQLIVGRDVFAQNLQEASERTGNAETIAQTKLDVGAWNAKTNELREQLWQYGQRQGSAADAAMAKREGKADELMKTYLSSGMSAQEAANAVHSIYPEVARYGQDFKKLPNVGKEDRDNAGKELTDIAKKRELLDQLSADPGQTLTKEQEKELGPIGGDTTSWYLPSNAKENREKGIAAARAALDQQELAVHRRLHGGSDAPPSASPTTPMPVPTPAATASDQPVQPVPTPAATASDQPVQPLPPPTRQEAEDVSRAPTKPTAQPKDDRVLMEKNGVKGYVPRSQVAAAKIKGYTFPSH